MVKWVVTVVVAALLLFALFAPFGPVPGLRIGGALAQPPAQWSEVELPGTIQLKTLGGLLPRVVNLWIVEADNALYVFGANSSGWVQSARRKPEVALRIGKHLYPLRAVPVDDLDPAIYEKYLGRYRADYPDIVADMPADVTSFEGGTAFRLERG